MITNDRATSFLEDALAAFLVGKTFKLALIKAGHTFNYTHAFTNVGTPGTGTPSNTNLGTDEVTGTGYTAGGITLAAPSLTVNGRVVRLDFPDPAAIANATISADGAVIYIASTGDVLGVCSFGGTVSSTANDFYVNLPAVGDATSLLRLP